MAEQLDINQMLANDFEPKRKYEWILEIDGIDAFTAKTAQRPKKNHEDITIDWVNVKRFLAGKPEWQPIKIELYDPISPSASQKVIQWMRLVHDDATGRMGYSAIYKKQFSIKMLDPMGTVIEKWTAKGAWIKETDFDDLAYEDNAAMMVSMTIRADYWILQY